MVQSRPLALSPAKSVKIPIDVTPSDYRSPTVLSHHQSDLPGKETCQDQINSLHRQVNENYRDKLPHVPPEIEPINDTRHHDDALGFLPPNDPPFPVKTAGG